VKCPFTYTHARTHARTHTHTHTHEYSDSDHVRVSLACASGSEREPGRERGRRGRASRSMLRRLQWVPGILPRALSPSCLVPRGRTRCAAAAGARPLAHAGPHLSPPQVPRAGHVVWTPRHGGAPPGTPVRHRMVLVLTFLACRNHSCMGKVRSGKVRSASSRSKRSQDNLLARRPAPSCPAVYLQVMHSHVQSLLKTHGKVCARVHASTHTHAPIWSPTENVARQHPEKAFTHAMCRQRPVSKVLSKCKCSFIAALTPTDGRTVRSNTSQHKTTC
jgi:hypothetical protein